MSRTTKPAGSDQKPLSSVQKQAVLVCVTCALAVLLTIGITLTLLQREKEPAASSEEELVPASTEEGETASGEDLSAHYQIDVTSAALLTLTEDVGTDYLNDTLFLGDSNTVRLYTNGLVSLQQFCAKEGIGTQAALTEQVVTFKGTSQHYTIPQAVAMLKPRRVVLTFGTNDTGMETADFIASYTALVQAIQESYPYTDIIVNTIPPIPENHSTYPGMDQAKIDDFNMALLGMCEQLGLKFLNSAEDLKGENGYGNAEYYTSGDIHLKTGGLKVMLNYLRTHAYVTEDRRPDTSNIPVRTLEYTSNPSSAVPAPSSSESASSSESSSSEQTAVQYEARYKVDKSGGGTLSTADESGKTSLSVGVTREDQTVTVTAVPADGYVFVKWSDGKTAKTRTDTDFQQNLEVTAVFSSMSVKIINDGVSFYGSEVNLRAVVSGKYASTEDLRWYSNGQELAGAAGHTSIRIDLSDSPSNATYKITAVLTYNDCTVTSNTLAIVVGDGGTSSSSASSDESSSSSDSGASSGSTSQSETASSSGSSGSMESSSAASSGSGSSGSSSASSGSSSSGSFSASSESSSSGSSAASGASASSASGPSESAGSSSVSGSSASNAASASGSTSSSSSGSSASSSTSSSGSASASSSEENAASSKETASSTAEAEASPQNAESASDTTAAE